LVALGREQLYVILYLVLYRCFLVAECENLKYQ